MNSNLQIISGKYRGRKLVLPKDARPTQNRARIALFNMLEATVIDVTQPMVVWDAFAGSGAFGIEFLSRYNDITARFTDVSPDSIKTVKKNLSAIEGNFSVEQIDALGAIKKYGPDSDVIFIDPPYSESSLAESFVRKMAPVAKPGTVIVWEMEKDTEFKLSDTDWTILKDKTYGRARFLILERN